MENLSENTTNVYEENDIIDSNMNNSLDHLSETFQNITLPSVETIVPVSYELFSRLRIVMFFLSTGVFVQLNRDIG